MLLLRLGQIEEEDALSSPISAPLFFNYTSYRSILRDCCSQWIRHPFLALIKLKNEDENRMRIGKVTTRGGDDFGQSLDSKAYVSKWDSSNSTA